MLRVSVRWQWAAPAIFIPLVVTGSLICYRAAKVREQAAVESAGAKLIPVRFQVVDPRPALAVENIPSASQFRDAAVFRGTLYLCGTSGLYGYNSAGVVSKSYRTGRELPPGELISLSATPTELAIATAGAGVLLFDGDHFRQIIPGDPHIHTFTSILGLSTGRLLLGTPSHGLLVWNGKTLEDFQPALKAAHITAMAGSDPDLWVGTLADGLWRLHAGQVDHFTSELPDTHVLSITLSHDSAYIGTPVGVVEFRDGRKSRNLAEGYFARSLEADDDTLAVGTEDEGIVTVPLFPKGEAAAFPVTAPVDRIFRLDGIRYSLAGSLYRSKSPSTDWVPVLAPEKGALADRNISGLNIAHDGRIWVGYFDRGLDVADTSFDSVRHFEDDHLFCINRIAEEPGGARTAVATANGLVMFDPSLTVRQILGRKDGLLADHVTDVLFRPGGMVIATPAGLSLAGADGIRSLYVMQGLVNNHVYSLASAGDLIAAGTLGGLSMLDRDAVTVNYTTANSGLKHNWISALVRVGDSWFAGTYGAGVMRLDSTGHWSAMTPAFEVNPNAMATSGSVVYVGSLGQGLWVYSGRWRNVTAGFPSLNVTAVAAANGYLYAGTDNGLVRFREEDLR